MQKLNGREIYVLVILFLATTILGFLMLKDIFSDISSVSSAQGVVSINQMDLRSHIKSLLQIILNISAIILFWRKKRMGWILAFPILLFYCFIISYVMIGFGYVDPVSTAVGFGGVLIFFLGLIFLLIPSTLRKYQVKKLTLIPMVVVTGLLVFLYFGII
jgi:hypothetical protein